MNEQPPSGQGPIDPRGAFGAPPAPPQAPHAQGGTATMPPPGVVPPPPPAYGTWGGPLPPPPPGMRMPGPMPMMMPPFMAPPPPRQGRGFVRGIFVTLATTIFGISLVANLYLLAFSGILSAGNAKQNVVAAGDPEQKVVVLPLSGLVADGMSQHVDHFITKYENDATVKAIVLEIDTPGGTVSASDTIHHHLMQYKQRHPGVPIVVTMKSLATSGGYYIASMADSIYAEPTTLTGNIGVLMPSYNVSKLAEKLGIEETTLESRGTPFKNAESPFRPPTTRGTEYMQAITDAMYVQFRDVVATGRAGKLKKPIEQVANGKAYLASEALELGLIDQIGYPHDAYDAAGTLAGLNRKTVVRYEEPQSLLTQLMSGDSKFGGAAGATGQITINGVNVNVDAESLNQLLTPRPMYLWRGQ